MAARNAKAYVWQHGRFEGDIDFWQNGVSVPGEVKPVKKSKCLSFFLATEDDFEFFRQAATKELLKIDWVDIAPDEEMDETELE